MVSAERESVKVVVRCRPFSEKEKAAGHSCIVSIDTEQASVTVNDPRSSNPATQQQADPPRTFTFDSAFDWNWTGKTFSMEGVRDVPELRGIIPNAFEHIFASIHCAPESTKFLVRASYLEIYNEEIRDLLNPKGGKLEVKERADIGVYVKDLKTFVIKDVEEMDRLMAFGNKNRSVGATMMNERSSRSHSIFSITVESVTRQEDESESIRAGKLHLVDLAGSERQSKTGATGDRLKEATKINLSLSALGNVISALVDGKSSHIPYRDSKLTRLLQDSLGGNARTLMIATMSPASYNYDETLSTLRYASRAKNIKNKPKVNEDPKDAMLREFQEEIKRLKAMLESGQAISPNVVEVVEEVEEIEEVEVEEEEEGGDAGSQSQQSNQQKSAGKTKKKSKKKLAPTATGQAEESGNRGISDGGQPQPDGQKSTLGSITESQLQKMQEMVEAEKRAIVESKDMEESEKNRLLNDLEVRARDLQREKEMREQLSAKLQQLEQKLLVGGVNLLDREQELKIEMAKKAAEMEERKRMERELERELEKSEEVNLQIEEEYASLQEEAVAKTRKLKKLWTLLMNAKSEVKDLREEHQREREDLLDTVRAVTRELKLRMLVVNQFVPRDYQALLESTAVWDEAAEKWRIPQVAHAGNNIRGKRSLVSGQIMLNTGGFGGLHRDPYNDLTETDLESQPSWSPLCVFSDPYLSYDVPLGTPAKKKVSTDTKSKVATDSKGSSGSVNSSNGSGRSQTGTRKGRPSSAMARRTPMSRSADQGNGNELGGDDGFFLNKGGMSSVPSRSETPTARGLVSKPKRYA
ncbi:Kinesin-like protein kif3a [Quaeritorhiza haematococci]|nr:Kinesin-like protein kif3a [Quaeritorhiza haematococci]